MQKTEIKTGSWQKFRSSAKYNDRKSRIMTRMKNLLLGIFRAMGMTMKEIIGMLINEQIFISLVSIALGVGAGVLTSRLYVPLVQIAYASADTVIPLQIVAEPSDMAKLLIVVAVMVALCMAVLGVLISRIRISQALKLGED